MRSAAFSPATAFTSIGKKIMKTMTAVFDSQPNPNHMTMMGATRDDRHGADHVAERQQAALQERHAVDHQRGAEPEQVAEEESGQHRLQEGLA